MGDQPVPRPLSTHRTAKTHKKRTRTSVPRVGFETTTPASERANTVHASDRVTTVIGTVSEISLKARHEQGTVQIVKSSLNNY
jgi:hypothetical protein